MKLITAFGLTALVALALAASVQPSAAMVIYPWCAQYGGRLGGSQNCGFTSFAQCQATRAGNGGFCVPHPVSQPPPPPAELAPAAAAMAGRDRDDVSRRKTCPPPRLRDARRRHTGREHATDIGGGDLSVVCLHGATGRELRLF